MKPKKKSRRCLGLASGLDLAISRFIYSLACTVERGAAGGVMPPSYPWIAHLIKDDVTVIILLLGVSFMVKSIRYAFAACDK